MLRVVISRTDWVQSWVVEYGGTPQLAYLIGAVKTAMALKSLHSANLQNFCHVPQYLILVRSSPRYVGSQRGPLFVLPYLYCRAQNGRFHRGKESKRGKWRRPILFQALCRPPCKMRPHVQEHKPSNSGRELTFAPLVNAGNFFHCGVACLRRCLRPEWEGNWTRHKRQENVSDS
jgi:hypothetical protein